MTARLLSRTIATGVLAAAFIAATVFVIGWYQFRTIGREIAMRTLGGAQALQAHIDEERRLKLEAETSDIATDADFAAAIVRALHVDADGRAAPDATELHNQIESRRTQYGFDGIALLNPVGTTITTAGDGYLYRRDLSQLGAVAQARRGAALASGLLDADGRIYNVSVAPLMTQSGKAALLLTTRYVDEAAMKTTARMSMTERARIAYGVAGPQVTASTLSPADAQALAALAKSERAEWQSRAGAGNQELFELEIGGSTWYAQIQPLKVTGNSTVRLALVPPAWHGPVLAALAPPLMIVAGSGIAVIAFAIGLYWFRTARPLIDLERLGQRVQRGDYALHGAETGSALARATVRVFNTLLAELGRYRTPPGAPRRRETDPH